MPSQKQKSFFTPPRILIMVLLLLLGWVLGAKLMSDPPKDVSLNEVIAHIESKEVKEASLSDGTRTIELTLKDGKKVTSGYPFSYGSTLFEKLDKQGVKTKTAPLTTDSLFSVILSSLLPVFVIVGFLFYFMRKGGGLGIGRLSRKRANPVEVPETRFSDVAGAKEVVEELQEVTEFLKNPEKFTAHGARVPRGFLLSGPPGTGKTLLARAVAGEAGVPFFALSGSDFVETFVGVGAGRMRELFEKAKEAERAIIFIDEIDAVGKARAAGVQTGANEERENTLNALLTEMDGFSQNSGIIILAATNRPDVLDPALTRPGRFDRKIVVPAPDRGGREEIFKLHSRKLTLKEGVNFAGLARRTPGLTGADISSLVNEAALEAARRGDGQVGPEHFESALHTTVLGRERRSAIISERDQEITSWHEAGHTVAALIEPEAHDPVTVTIVPRGPAGGVTWMGGSENDFMTKTQAMAQLVVSMAGRAAEEILLKGDYTQGAQGDLQNATALASDMISRYGMGARLVSLPEERMSMGDMESLNNEVSALLQKALDKARGLLAENQNLLTLVAERLREVETLNLEEIRALKAQVDSKRD